LKETYVGDTVKIVLKTGIDLTGYSYLFIRFKRPDGTTGEWVSEVGDDDTWMEYTTDESDLDISGVWTLQARAESTGVMLNGKFVNFQVYIPIADLVEIEPEP
jgi:hypothetical protein